MRHARSYQRLALGAGITIGAYAVALCFALPMATNLWIWPASSRLGLAFVGSWFAGGAVVLVWVGLSGQLRALRALLLTVVVAYTGSALHLVARSALPGKERFLPFAGLFAIGAISAGIAVVALNRLPPRGDRASPPIIRWAFLLFAAILLPTGTALLLNRPHVFPIGLSADMAAVYGWFFVASFVYYFYGFLKPSELNATGQLLSFVIYDVLLIPPFAAYWADVPPEFERSLAVYLIVLIGSSVFCGYFLLVDPATRLFKRSERVSPAMR